MNKALRSLALPALLFATPALAHTGQDDASGLVHGFLHPIGGLDHVLAMVAVGLIAAQLGGRALRLVPVAFLAMMALGGALGAAGLALPFVEFGIALSVVVLGVLVALNLPLPIAGSMILVGAFATFHGYAHGAEMPAAASGLAYGLGFVAATALLHAAGIGLGLLAGRSGGALGRPALQVGGAGLAAAGAALLVGAL
ncbi:MAG TPA: HupE/UreJ family protein [Methylobacterium sp.]|jgi:urease accessory protein